MQHLFTIKNYLIPLVTTIFILSTGCFLSRPESSAFKKNDLPEYWLTTSMYAGAFYDDDKLTLMDVRPFFAIDDVQTLDGYTLYPPKSTHTIPAGTLVQIVDISYPSYLTKLKRPIFAPRDNIWLYLRVAKERGLVNVFHEKTHVLLIPSKINNDKQLRKYLGNFLSKKDPNEWILQLETYMQEGIFNKSPMIGMKKKHVYAALGPAVEKQFQKQSDFHGTREIWHYHNYFVIIVDNAVEKVKDLLNGKSVSKSKEIHL